MQRALTVAVTVALFLILLYILFIDLKTLPKGQKIYLIFVFSFIVVGLIVSSILSIRLFVKKEEVY